MLQGWSAGRLLRRSRPKLTGARQEYQSLDPVLGKSLLRPLWQKYRGQGPPGEAGGVLRLIVRVTPQKVIG